MLEFSMPTRGQIRADLDEVMRRQKELQSDSSFIEEVQKKILQDLETQEQQLRSILDVIDNDKPFSL